DEDSVALKDLMHEFVYSEMPTTTIDVKGEKFEMVNLCLKSSTRNQTPRLHWGAASRVVMEENLTGKVPGLYGRLKDESDAEFTYACYLSSDFLDTRVRSDRTGFDIAERVTGESLIDDVSQEDIRTDALKEVERILATRSQRCPRGGQGTGERLREQSLAEVPARSLASRVAGRDRRSDDQGPGPRDHAASQPAEARGGCHRRGTGRVRRGRIRTARRLRRATRRIS